MPNNYEDIDNYDDKIEIYSFLISLKAEYEFNTNKSAYRRKNLSVPYIISCVEDMVDYMLDENYDEDLIRYVIVCAVEDLLFIYKKYDDYHSIVEEYSIDYSENWKEGKNSLFDDKNIEYSCDATVLLHSPKGIKSYNVPDGVKEIGEYAFSNCEGLICVTFPDTLYKVSDFAFSGCINLVEIRLPDSLHQLGICAFQGCYDLERINIPLNLKNFNGNVLLECESINDIYIPDNHPHYKKTSDNCIIDISGKTLVYFLSECDNVILNHEIKRVSSYAFIKSELNNVILHCDIKSFSPKNFADDYSLSNIFVESGSECYCSIDGVLLSKDRTKLIRYPNGRESVDIESSVIELGEYAFYCSTSEEINIPSNITSIGNNCFEACWASKVNISHNIAIIPKYAFNGCVSLKSIFLSKNVSTIGEKAFKLCHELRTVIVMNEDCDIANDAFEGCENIQCAFLPKSMLYSNLFKDSKYAIVYDCSRLFLGIGNSLYVDGGDILVNVPKDYISTTFIALPNTKCVKSLALKNCKGIKKVYLPKTINRIESYAFYGCYSLKEIWIYDPDTYDSAMHTIDKLTAVELHYNKNISIEVDAFVNSGISDETLNEEELLDKYCNLYKSDLEEMGQFFESRNF